MNAPASLRSVLTSAALLSATAVLTWVAWRSLRAAGRDLRRLLELRRALRRGFRHLGPGRVAIRGRVTRLSTDEPLLRGPLGQSDGVYLAFAVDRWDASHHAFGRGAAGGKWVRTDEDEVAIPFGLSDGESTVLVDPEGAEVLLPERVSYTGPDSSCRYREAVLTPGTEVVVLGTAASATAAAPEVPYRGSSARTVVGSDLLLTSPAFGWRRLLGRAAWRTAGAVPAPLVLALTAWQLFAPAPATGGTVACGVGGAMRTATLAPAHRRVKKARDPGRISAPQVIYDWPKRPRF